MGDNVLMGLYCKVLYFFFLCFSSDSGFGRCWFQGSGYWYEGLRWLHCTTWSVL